MVLWVVASLLSPILLLFAAWLALPLQIGIHVGAAADALWCLRRVDAAPPRHRSLAAAAMVASLVFGPLWMFGLQSFSIPSSSQYPMLEIGDYIFVEKISKLWRGQQRGDLIVLRKPCDPDHEYVERVIAVAGDTVEVRCGIVYVNHAAFPTVLVEAHDHYDDFLEENNTWHTRHVSRYRETIDGVEHDIFQDADRPERDAAFKQTGHLEVSTLVASKDFPQLERREPSSCATQEYTSEAANPDQKLGQIVETKRPAGVCEQQLHYIVPEDSLFTMGDNRWNSNDSRFWGVVPTSYVVGRVTGIWMGREGQRTSRMGSVR
jgi:signal peptidase I